jgi:hypothetical protein
MKKILLLTFLMSGICTAVYAAFGGSRFDQKPFGIGNFGGGSFGEGGDEEITTTSNNFVWSDGNNAVFNDSNNWVTNDPE